MKTNGCHYRHYTSYRTGSITKPDKELSSWPTWFRGETLHLGFYFFIPNDCDAVTYGSAVPKGKCVKYGRIPLNGYSIGVTLLDLASYFPLDQLKL